jgi:ribose/xylose/arabinose/galactoside ABC-type transport system permease subunit
MTPPVVRRALPYALPVALLAVGAALVAGQVERPAAVLDMWRPWGEIGILAMAMTAIVLAGGIDLSVGSVIALVSVCFGLLCERGVPVEAACGLALGVGLAAGAVNGTLVVWGIAPLVATLATMATYAGLAMALSRGERIAGLAERFTQLGQGSLLGVPNQMIVFLAATAIAWIIMHHTRFGRYLFAIGDNPLAAEFAAVPVRFVQWSLYAASGVVAALVALVLAARGGAAVPGAGAGIELVTIACVVVGGTRITGGAGGVGRTLLGVATLSLLDIGF